MKDGELRCGAHSWNTSELESKSFAARTPADVVDIPALSRRKHLRRANRRLGPASAGGRAAFRADTAPHQRNPFLRQTMKVPSLGLRDKNRQSGERGKDWDLMTLQKAEETGKKGAPTERAGDRQMINSPLAWVGKAGSGGWAEPARS